jgi:N-carbamoylputrescine amidase
MFPNKHAERMVSAMQLTVALLQMTACSDRSELLSKGEVFCRRAHGMGADLALFPETWNALLSFPHPQEDLWQAPELWPTAAPDARPIPDPAAYQRWLDQAVSQDDPYGTHFRELARDLGMAIALTYLEAWPAAPRHPRDTVSLIDQQGHIVLTYAKVHTCDFDEEEFAYTPGDDFPVCTLQTSQGPLRVGAMICYDREFPESARILMLQRAEIILVPNACQSSSHSLMQFRTRAYENVVGLAMTNYAAPSNNGHSLAVDGITEDEQGNARDMLLVEAGESEGIYLATFDLDALRAHRLRHTGGNAFRRPHRYHRLTSLEIDPPFVRVNRQGEPYDPSRR